jgi:predicted DNA-binding ribbon-helix-helix protein
VVVIEIDDEVWGMFKRSWALLGMRTDDASIRMLEGQLWRALS